jgi:2-methylcitrate dehydratase PrpD
VRIGDPPNQHLERYKSGATVTIEMQDGRTHASTVYAPRGAAVRGIEWADVEAKYRALVPYADVAESDLEASLKVVRRLGEVQSVSALVGLLRSRAV